MDEESESDRPILRMKETEEGAESKPSTSTDRSFTEIELADVSDKTQLVDAGVHVMSCLCLRMQLMLCMEK